jgi:asparagine synthetase B (glutamine-hydrolysing)
LPIRGDRTFFDAVRRVPAGHTLRVSNGARSVSRYWDPAPPGKPIDWVKPEEMETFGALLDQAVARCLKLGPMGIYLSGGLDSGGIAAVAADNSRRLGISPPIAFSLLFPDPECGEEQIQRGVAAGLGLEQVAVGFDEAIGHGDLLAPALEISSRLPAPLDNFWLPAYFALAKRAKRLGCDWVLTGIGGDEWLSVTPMLAADLIPSLDFAGLYRLWQVSDVSYKLPRLAMTRNLLWSCGIRPLLGEAGASVLGRWAPGLLEARRRGYRRRRIPQWFSDDPALRGEIEEHLIPVVPVAEAGGFYLRDVKAPLDHYLASTEFEEDFEIAHRGGVRRLHPYLDADLLGFLLRTPPDLLCRGGRAKGLIRSMLSARFPGLGFERQRKVGATNFIQTRLLREGKGVWDQMGKSLALADLGVIDAKRWELTLQRVLAQNDRSQLHYLWLVSTMEKWLRARS